MGWVDLCQGILLCNLLIDKPELHKTHIKKLTCGSYVSDNWRVATSSWKTDLKSWKGHRQDRLECDASHIEGSVSDLLGYNSSTPLPRLRRLRTGLPTLSLEDDDVVFVMAKVDHRDDEAFLLGVNMRMGTIEVADCFDAERMIGFSFGYTQMRIYHYLSPGI